MAEDGKAGLAAERASPVATSSFKIECRDPEIVKKAVMDLEDGNVSCKVGEGCLWIEVKAEDANSARKISLSIQDKVDLANQTIEQFAQVPR